MRKPKYRVLLGDNRKTLLTIPDKSISCCVTSPPYYGLRDYGGMEEQIGLEATPEEYVAELVKVFEEVKRVLRDDGTLWLNIGDTHYNYRPTSGDDTRPHSFGGARTDAMKRGLPKDNSKTHRGRKLTTVKQKDLIGIPWMLAFALRAAGWYLRQDIIWSKPNPMPESVGDRCTKAHEYIFLLTKKPRYYFDKEAAKEAAVTGGQRKRRSVWHVPTVPYKGAHFATFPPELIEPCIRIGAPKGSRVLDPFGGSGTTAGVALALGCDATLCELDPNSAKLVKDRVKSIGRAYKLKLNEEQDMEIKLSVSAFKPKVQTGDPKRDLATSPSGRQSVMSATEITNIAQSIVDKMRKRNLPIRSEHSLRKAATEAVNSWVNRSTASKLTKEVKQKAATKLVNRVVALFNKSEPKGVSAPNGTDAKAKKFSKAEIEKIAGRLVHYVKFSGAVDSKNKDKSIDNIVKGWADMHSVQYPNQSRMLNKDAVKNQLVELVNKKAGGSKKAPASAPSDKVVPTTKAATKEEKLKAQILAGTKLRNQFQGMLAKAPSMTSKSIENIRKHCDAYLKVINVVQKGKAELAETTKIEGLRGIESVKNYVNNVLGLTYGYVEIAKQLGVAQTALKSKINEGIIEELSNVQLKRAAKANAQRALDPIAKALSKRNCQLPTSFQREVEKVFLDAAMSGDIKKAKEVLRDRIDILVADVFRNKTKLYSAK